MRVLLVSHYLPPHVGGIEVLVNELAARLSAAGHLVSLVTSAAGAEREEPRQGVHRIPAWNILEEKLHVPFPIFAPSLLPVMRAAVRDADVVHAHGVLYLTSWVALLFCWWYGKPLVVTEHVGFVPYASAVLNAVQRTVLRVLTPLFLRGAQAVVTYNRRVFDWLQSFEIHPERLCFVVNGIDTEHFRPGEDGEKEAIRRDLGLPAEAPLALFVGRFVQKKRPDLMLRSGDPSFEIVMCGHGDLPSIDSASTVHVLRDVAHRDMPLIYRAADVMVLPSQGEGFPVAIMEAMASGLPVVACADRAYDEYVTDDELLQVPAEAAAIRAAVARLAGDPHERSRRAEAARRRAVADFSLQRSADQHLEIYAAAVRTRGLATVLRPLGYDLPTQVKLPALRSLLRRPEGRPCIDVGPGTGYLADALIGAGPIVAVDVAHDNLLALRRKAVEGGAPERFLAVRADLMQLPFKSGSAATILCTQVLEHVEEDRRAARELARVLAPGGQLLVEVPHIGAGYASHLERLGVQTVHDVPGPEYHCRPGYTAPTLRELFADSGVSLVASKLSLGRVGMLTVDAVSLIHLAYQRLRHGRTSWTWADVGALQDSPMLRVYRLVFPALRLVARIDRLWSDRPGFILAARFEKDRANSEDLTRR